jgi:hypothetical protein
MRRLGRSRIRSSVSLKLFALQPLKTVEAGSGRPRLDLIGKAISSRS